MGLRISFNTRIKKPDTLIGMNGYGVATRCLLESLAALGHEVTINDPTAPVGLVFDHPQFAHFYPNQYKILFCAWESTKLQDGWKDIMNNCDEIWSPSEVLADWYKDAGIERPIFIYHHGIDHSWFPLERKIDNEIKFLMVGFEATRKGGWDTMRLFRQAFPTRSDVSLTLKGINSSWNQISKLGRVEIINEAYSFEQLQELFYSHHIYVYPSWGEGFGLTPFQAMATAMPTISTAAWAPYKNHFHPQLAIDSKLVTSPWEEIHPGKMFRPDFDSVIDAMRYAADNFDEVSAHAMSHSSLIHQEYDWIELTKKAFGYLENRLKLDKKSQ